MGRLDLHLSFGSPRKIVATQDKTQDLRVDTLESGLRTLPTATDIADYRDMTDGISLRMWPAVELLLTTRESMKFATYFQCQPWLKMSLQLCHQLPNNTKDKPFGHRKCKDNAQCSFAGRLLTADCRNPWVDSLGLMLLKILAEAGSSQASSSRNISLGSPAQESLKTKPSKPHFSR